MQSFLFLVLFSCLTISLVSPALFGLGYILHNICRIYKFYSSNRWYLLLYIMVYLLWWFILSLLLQFHLTGDNGIRTFAGPICSQPFTVQWSLHLVSDHWPMVIGRRPHASCAILLTKPWRHSSNWNKLIQCQIFTFPGYKCCTCCHQQDN